jgi:hypothetical protein
LFSRAIALPVSTLVARMEQSGDALRITSAKNIAILQKAC